MTYLWGAICSALGILATTSLLWTAFFVVAFLTSGLAFILESFVNPLDTEEEGE